MEEMETEEEKVSCVKRCNEWVVHQFNESYHKLFDYCATTMQISLFQTWGVCARVQMVRPVAKSPGYVGLPTLDRSLVQGALRVRPTIKDQGHPHRSGIVCVEILVKGALIGYYNGYRVQNNLRGIQKHNRTHSEGVMRVTIEDFENGLSSGIVLVLDDKLRKVWLLPEKDCVWRYIYDPRCLKDDHEIRLNKLD